MKFLVAVLFSLLVAGLVVFAVGRFFPRSTGKSTLRRLLWAQQTDWRGFPDACLEALVDDAIAYAREVSAAAPQGDFLRKRRFIEFNRKLRIHAYVLAELSRGRRGAQITERVKSEVREIVQQAVLAGATVEAAWAQAQRTSAGQFMDDAYAVAAASCPSGGAPDAAAQSSAKAAVDNGTAWHFQEQLLARYTRA
jgi:hypothetical protein